MDGDYVHCPNCGTVYLKPPGDLRIYRCANCQYPYLALMPQDTSGKTALAVLGALIGAGLVGVPGAIVGGLIGYLAGGGEEEGGETR